MKMRLLKPMTIGKKKRDVGYEFAPTDIQKDDYIAYGVAEEVKEVKKKDKDK